jgi:hypothetical protein
MSTIQFADVLVEELDRLSYPWDPRIGAAGFHGVDARARRILTDAGKTEITSADYRRAVRRALAELTSDDATLTPPPRGGKGATMDTLSGVKPRGVRPAGQLLGEQAFEVDGQIMTASELRAHAARLGERDEVLAAAEDSGLPLQGADLHSRALLALRKAGKGDTYSASEYSEALSQAELPAVVRGSTDSDSVEETVLAMLDARGIGAVTPAEYDRLVKRVRDEMEARA